MPEATTGGGSTAVATALQEFTRRLEAIVVSRTTCAAAPTAVNMDDAAAKDDKKLFALGATAAPLYNASFREVLDDLAAYLIRHCCILCGDKGDHISKASAKYSLVEVEMYAYAPGVFEDRFTHRDAQQATTGSWYFHKKGGTYKNGSFKGLDITFGSGGTLWGGALIRAIQPLAVVNAAVVEGPSLVVDELLRATKSTSIVDLVGSKDGVLAVDTAFGAVAGLALVAREEPLPDNSDAHLVKGVCVAPRVGLVPRQPSDLFYAGRLFRYIAPGVKLGKQRGGIIAALLALGATSAEAQRRTGGTLKNVEAIKSIVQKVLGGDIDVVASDGAEGALGKDVMEGSVIGAIVAWATRTQST